MPPKCSSTGCSAATARKCSAAAWVWAAGDLEIDTKWLQDYGVIAAKDFLTPDQFYKYENQSEEKINKVREPAAAFARKLLGA